LKVHNILPQKVNKYTLVIPECIKKIGELREIDVANETKARADIKYQ
jgi:hypothetical protein